MENFDFTDDEWKAKLTPEQYRLLRKKKTERAFSGEYHDLKDKGTYLCAGCGEPLFHSKSKYDSGTGWPSFYEPLGDIEYEEDYSLFMSRTEVLCPKCHGHLGHVFDDGPQPTGKRFCINSGALKFKNEQ